MKKLATKRNLVLCGLACGLLGAFNSLRVLANVDPIDGDTLRIEPTNIGQGWMRTERDYDNSAEREEAARERLMHGREERREDDRDDKSEYKSKFYGDFKPDDDNDGKDRDVDDAKDAKHSRDDHMAKEDEPIKPRGGNDRDDDMLKESDHDKKDDNKVDMFAADARGDDDMASIAVDKGKHFYGDDDDRDHDRAVKARGTISTDLGDHAGPIVDIAGDWVPDKIDMDSNGGFGISPDFGSPVPYHLDGHIDLQRARPGDLSGG